MLESQKIGEFILIKLVMSSSLLLLFARLGWVFVLLGWTLASVFANGGETWKVAVVTLLVVPGSGLCLFAKKENFRVLDWVVLLVGGYFLSRACLSPVYDIARFDILLIGLGMLAYFSSSTMMQSVWGRQAFLLFLVLGLLLQIGGVSWQFFEDSSWRFLRSPRAQEITSGLFYLQNYFVGFLELLVPTLFAWMIWQRRLSPLVWLAGGLLILGVVCTFLAQVRSGAVAFSVAFLLVAFNAVKARDLESLAGRITSNTVGRVLVVVIGVAILGLSVLGTKMVIESRGGEEAAAMNLHARLQLAGTAFDTWKQSPIFGVGGNGFSYYFPQLCEDLRRTFGDAKTAHNEYLQVLANYGVVGLGLVMLLWGVSFYHALISLSFEKELRWEGRWLPIVVVAVLVSELLRATIDFNLHSLPNFLALSMLVGSVSNSRRLEKSRGGLVRLLVVASCAGLLLYVSRKDFLVLPSRWQLMTAEVEGNELEALKNFEIIRKQAPEFLTSRRAGRMSLKVYLLEPNQVNLERTRKDWEQAAGLHPFDGEVAANLARVYSEGGSFQEAEVYYERAIMLTGRREKTYGVLYAFAGYLAKRGQESWKARSPGQALGWFLEAREVLKISSFRGEGARDLINFVNNRIVFFTQTRVESEEIMTIDWVNAFERSLEARPASLSMSEKPQISR